MATYTIPELLSQVRIDTKNSYLLGKITLSELREKARVRRRNTSPTYKATRKRYFTSDKGRATQREYSRTPKGQEVRRNWHQANPEKGAAQSAGYRTQLLKATPPWVANNPAMMNAINGMYRVASLMNLNHALPGRFEVHHIVPLDKGGLNVPWNLEVTDRFTNRSLGSKMPSQDRAVATQAEVKGTARSRGGIPYNPKLLNTQGQFLPAGSIFGRQLKKRNY